MFFFLSQAVLSLVAL